MWVVFKCVLIPGWIAIDITSYLSDLRRIILKDYRLFKVLDSLKPAVTS